MGDLSAHFDSSEFRSSDGVDAPSLECRLIAILEVIRFHAGKPVRIVSGYRTLRVNDSVGGALNSRHLTAEAADIEPGLVRLEEARRAGAGGVGINKDGWVVHVDIGPERTWRYR